MYVYVHIYIYVLDSFRAACFNKAFSSGRSLGYAGGSDEGLRFRVDF